MTRDSEPPGPAATLSEDALAALRRSVQAYLEAPEETAGLRSALRDAAAEAKARQVRAERLIIALKQVWHSAPEVRGASTRQEQDRLLDRLITVCIEEYYRDR